MKIGFVGDIHGRMFHMLAVLAAWQQIEREKLDLIVQVGDLGAFPVPDEVTRASRFVMEDPTELDFSRYLHAEGEIADHIRHLRNHMINRVYFIRGNHEDFHWLHSRRSAVQRDFVPVDPFDLLYYATDGAILHHHGLNIAFLGGIETPTSEQHSIDPHAYENLMSLQPRSIDILVTHDAPYGIAKNFRGETQGSSLIKNLIHRIEPKYLISGHYHHMNGPASFGFTTYLGLNILVPPLRRDENRRVQPGSLAILDTETNHLKFVTEDWLSRFAKGFDFIQSMDELRF